MKIKTHSSYPAIVLPKGLFNLTLFLCLWGYGPMANADPQVHPYNIPAGSLATALGNLAESSDLQVIYRTGLTQGLSSKGLKGSYSTEAALQKLLSGTGLTYSLAEGAVTIRAAEKAPNPVVPVANPKDAVPMPESTLPKITVESDALRDVTDPYNTDYVLPNATSGTKTDTPIMETPLNVQVISKQVLKDQQVINLGQALQNVSGVTTNTNATQGVINERRAGGQQITLRGFESETFFRNGFRLQQGSVSRNMSNVESVEVLKGPAAILYGLVEPGGMVNVVTKQPLATPYYGFNQQFGSYDLYRTTFDATGPIANNKDVLYRMNMSYENSGSFRDFVGKEDVFLAPVLKWNISPRTQATFELEYNRQHAGLDTSFVPVVDGKLSNIPFNRNYGEYSANTTETIFGGFNWSHMFNDDWTIKHRFSVNQQSNTIPNAIQPIAVLPDGFTSIPGPGGILLPIPSTVGNTTIPRTHVQNQLQNNTYSTNLDLVGHFDTRWLKHTLLLGGDYYRLNTTFKTATNFDVSLIDAVNPTHPGTPFFLPLLQNGSATDQIDQYGLYAQDQIKLPYDIHVTGGLRYQYIHQKTLNIASILNGGGPNSSTAQTQDAVTPRVGILWQPQGWVSLYANYTESFGANTGLTWPNFQPVAPTSASQYEGGIKTQFFDGRLRATLAYYDLTKTNVQVGDPDLNHNCGSGPGSCSLAIGAIRSRGPELDIQGEILPGWNLIATWANQDIVITKTDANNDPILIGLNNGSLSVGNRLFNVPRNIGSLWSTYEVQGGDLKGLKFGGGVKYQDEQVACCDGTIKATPGFATVGLLAAYSRDVGKAKVTAQLNVDNLLDKRYFSSITSTGFGAGYVGFGQPRTFMGSVSIQY